MKTKKIVSIVLAIVMVVGILPMSAIAQTASEYIATVHGVGEYTDMNTVPEKSYQYTVKGSDGSSSIITLLGTDADTGNKLVKTASVGDVYYKREKDFKATGDNYLIVGLNSGRNFAMKKDAKNVVEVNIVNDPQKGEIIKGDYSEDEWSIIDRGNADYGNVRRDYVNKDNKHIYLKQNKTLELIDGNTDVEIRQWNGNFRVFRWYSASLTRADYIILQIDENGVRANRNNVLKSASWDSGLNAATDINYFKRVTVAQNEYTIDTAALEQLIEEAKKREFQQSYEDQSWQRFAGALADAEHALAQTKVGNNDKVYVGDEEAEKALKNVETAHVALVNAINSLKIEIGLNECVMPEITWTRSYGDASEDPKDERVLGLTTVEDNIAENFPIVWKWDSVKDIQASSKVPWFTNDKGMRVGTWSDPDDGWTKSSVRRISGTFIWPYGYDFNDKAEILSVNDSVDKKSGAYADIYRYIEENKDTPEGKKIYERYKNSRVFAVNDNMYVFISKADEQPSDWTAEQAAQRMAFWTGTDGKGVWSDNHGHGGDWKRTTPATFLGKSAVPSFLKIWPNVEDMNLATGASLNSSNIKEWKNANLDNATAHSEGWYSLVDTSNIMTTLKNTYGTEDMGGQKMRIEVFAFDNSGKGGMDELQLRICSPSADDIPVQVDYFMNVNGNKIKLENMSTIFYTTEGAQHILQPGTFVNGLNYAKAEAERKAPAGTVISDGEQINKDFTAHKGQTNIIQVEYKATLKGMEYFSYDFATKNQFTYHDSSTTNIESVTVEGIPGLKVVSFDNNTHDIILEYTPLKSVDQAQLGNIVIYRQDSSQKFPIAVVPASNVLYEENFMTPRNLSNAPDWTLSSKPADAVVVKDNAPEESVFGYTKEYANNKGMNGAYEVTVDSTTLGRTSDELSFDFNGQGFDLIGTCGPNTGTIMVSVRDDQNTPVKAYMVNTAYSGGVINQVPLIHCMDLPRGTYHVLVKAMHVDYAPAQSKMTYSLRNSASAPNNAAYNALVKLGMSDEEISNVEFINIADRIEPVTFSLYNAPAAPAAAPETMQVSLDAFRVYRSTQNAQEAYPAEECNIKYSNILDAQEGSFTAYVEGNAEGKYNVADYRKMGGPANELYLKPKTAIAIAVADGVTNTQISLRAVNGPVNMSINEGEQKIINHNTEMYYRVTATSDGLIVIANTSETEILAVGNLKCGVKAINDSQKARAEHMTFAMMNAPVTPDEPESQKFVPQKFDVRLSVIRGLFNNYAIITATTSTDVGYIEINGTKCKADNARLVNIGLNKNNKFITSIKFKKNEPISVEITAYDRADIASETIIKSK